MKTDKRWFFFIGTEAELIKVFPVMLEAARRIRKEVPEAAFFLPVAQGIDRTLLARMTQEAGVDVRFTESHTYDLMGEMRFALATSGTVVLEAALMGLPCIVLCPSEIFQPAEYPG